MSNPAIFVVQQMPGSPIPPELPPTQLPDLPSAPPEVDMPLQEPNFPVREPGSVSPMQA